jgi:hypothetical protein
MQVEKIVCPVPDIDIRPAALEVDISNIEIFRKLCPLRQKLYS